MHVRICICTYLYICMCACLCTYLYICMMSHYPSSNDISEIITNLWKTLKYLTHDYSKANMLNVLY